MKIKLKLCAMLFALLCIAIIFEPNKVLATDTVEVETFEDMRDALESGKSVKLMNDIQITGKSVLKSTRNLGVAITGIGDITVDGNGFTVSGTADKVRTIFEIYAGDEILSVTFKNIDIENAYAYGRCIDTRTGNIKLVLDNSTLKTTSTGNNQSLTVGGKYSSPNTIDLIKSSISAGKSGYGITTFNPINLTIKESDVVGYGALYLQGTENISGLTNAMGTAGSTISVVDSKLVGFNEHDGGDNNFATIIFEDDNIKMNIENSEIGDPRIGTAYQYVIMEKRYGREVVENKTANEVSISNTSITITDGILLMATEVPETKITIADGVTSTVQVEDYLAEDIICKEEGPKYVTYKKHSIIIDKNILNGTVTVNTDKAIVGDTINLSVKPDEGYQLKSLKAYTAADTEIEIVDGKFIMPNLGAIVIAEFEKIPTEVDFVVPEDKTEDNNIGMVETEKVKDTLDTSLKADTKLNEKVEEARKNGETVKVEIKMETLEKDNVKDEEKQIILQTVKANQKVQQYFDISVLVTSNQEQLGKLTKLTNKMKFSVEISKDLMQEGRTFYILKLHNGEVKRIDGVINGTKLEFETDEFSTFALAYEDSFGTAEPEREPEKEPIVENKEKDETPKTGAISIPAFIWVSIAGIALIGLATTKKSSKHSK